MIAVAILGIVFAFEKLAFEGLRQGYPPNSSWDGPAIDLLRIHAVGLVLAGLWYLCGYPPFQSAPKPENGPP